MQSRNSSPPRTVVREAISRREAVEAVIDRFDGTDDFMDFINQEFVGRRTLRDRYRARVSGLRADRAGPSRRPPSPSSSESDGFVADEHWLENLEARSNVVDDKPETRWLFNKLREKFVKRAPSADDLFGFFAGITRKFNRKYPAPHDEKWANVVVTYAKLVKTAYAGDKICDEQFVWSRHHRYDSVFYALSKISLPRLSEWECILLALRETPCYKDGTTMTDAQVKDLSAPIFVSHHLTWRQREGICALKNHGYIEKMKGIVKLTYDGKRACDKVCSRVL